MISNNYNMFEALYHIVNPNFGTDRLEDIQSLAEALEPLLAKDKRKKFALLTGTIFAPKSTPENVQGRLFLDESRDTGVGNYYSALSLLKVFQKCEMPIGIVCKKGEIGLLDKLKDYGVIPLSNSDDKWEIYKSNNLRFNVQPTNTTISGALQPGQFIDVSITKSVNISITYDNKNYPSLRENEISRSNASGVLSREDYTCWDLKRFVCHKLVLEIKNKGIQHAFSDTTTRMPAPVISDEKQIDISKENKNTNNVLKDTQAAVKLNNEDTKSSSQIISSETLVERQRGKAFEESGTLPANILPHDDILQESKNAVLPTIQPAAKNVDNSVPIINNAEYQLKKMKEILLSKNVDANIIENILEQHEMFIKSIDVSHASTWKLKQLRWSNIYCYGSDNVIDFTKLSGVVSLVGKNKTGKSSVLDIIIYLLFNHINRGTVHDLCNRTTSTRECWAELIFSVQSALAKPDQDAKLNVRKSDLALREQVAEDYLLRFSRINGSKAEVSLYQNGILISSNNKTVYENMEKLLGPQENFINSVLSIQESTQFLDLGSSQQQKILESLFGLDKLKVRHDELKVQLNAINAQLKQLVAPQPLPKNAGRNFLKESEALQSKPFHAGETKRSKKDSNDEDDDANEPSEVLETMLNEDATINTQFENLMKSLSEINARMDRVSTLRIQNLELLSETKSKLDEYQRQILKSQSDQIKDYREKIAVIEKSFNFSWNTATCPSCKSNKMEFSRVTGYDVAKAELEKLIRGCRTTDSLIAEQQFAGTRSLVSDCEQKKQSLEQEYDLLKVKKSKLESELAQNKEKKSKLDNIRGMLAKKINAPNYQMMLRDHENYNKKKSELESQQKLLMAHTAALDHKFGLGHSILMEKSEIICKRMNELLSGICSFGVKFQFTASQLNINIVQDKYEFDSSLGSGYQRFVINLVLRIVAANQACISMPKFLIIDEGFGCLDAINLGLVTELLHRIKKYFDFILIISHIGELQNLSDIKLAISHVNGISNIKNTETPIVYKFSGVESKSIATNREKPSTLTPNTVTSTKSDDLETVTRGNVEKIYCKLCKKDLLKRPGVEVKHIATKGHQKLVGKKN